MFKRKINHPKKPDCTDCLELKIQCDFYYATCHDYTGFTTPCITCKKISKCLAYVLASKRQKPIYECPKWIMEGTD